MAKGKGSKSGNKGKRLERDVKDFLNAHFDSQEFSRTPGSGAFMGQSNFAKKQGLDDGVKRALGSDIICPEWFRFSIECKNYDDQPVYSSLIGGRSAHLDKWLAETIFDSINFKLTPMLIFRTTRKGTYVAIPQTLFDHFGDSTPDNYLVYSGFVIVSLDDFKLTPFNDANNEAFDAIQTQLVDPNGVYVQYLQSLLEVLSSTPASIKANKAKIGAMTNMLNEIK